MTDLSEEEAENRSIIDTEEFLSRYSELALNNFYATRSVHPLENRKSDKLETIIPLVRSLRLESEAKRLPVSYHNWPLGRWENAKIRFDNIPASAAAYWFCAVAPLLGIPEIYFEDESKGYAFLDFYGHNYASKFIEKFNNKPIPGTDTVYQLSWAPFRRNPFWSPPEKGIEVRQSDPSKSLAEKIMEKAPADAGVFSKIRAFHKSFSDEVLSGREASRVGGAFDRRRGVRHGIDDGRTTVLCLTMVDPCVEEGFMKKIFEKYGECTIDIPNKEGCGVVKYKDRKCAEEAITDLENLFIEEKVCGLQWGIDKERLAADLERWKLAASERQRQRLRLCWLYGQNDRERKAIVKTETRKPKIAGKSVSKAKRARKNIDAVWV